MNDKIRMIQNYRPVYDSPIMKKGSVYRVSDVEKILKRLEKHGDKKSVEDLVNPRGGKKPVAVYVKAKGATGLPETTRKVQQQSDEAAKAVEEVEQAGRTPQRRTRRTSKKM
jgi:hypothetical protein